LLARNLVERDLLRRHWNGLRLRGTPIGCPQGLEGPANVDRRSAVSRATLVSRGSFEYLMTPMFLLALLLAAGPGALTGKITLNGLPPKLANLPVVRDMKVCGNTKPDESLEVGNGGALKNAVVWLTDVPLPADYKPGKDKLDQQQCVFLPHVLAAPVGST